MAKNIGSHIHQYFAVRLPSGDSLCTDGVLQAFLYDAWAALALLISPAQYVM